MAIPKENLVITITLEYSNFTIEGTLIATLPGWMHKYLVIETKKHVYVFNANDVSITKVAFISKDSNSVFTYYSDNQIAGILTRVYSGRVTMLSPRLGVKDLSIEQTDDTNTITLDITENDFISEVTGKKASKYSVDTEAVKSTSIIPISNMSVSNDSRTIIANSNNAYNYYNRGPLLLGNLNDIFGEIDYENNRKPIGYATAGGGG